MNIEKLFYQDIRNKKRSASGVYHRASRKGYIKGGIKTQSDFMTKKEKEKLNGEVKVYNMYDKYSTIENIPSIKEIERMNLNEKVNLYKFLKSNYSNKDLQRHWNISNYSLYNNIFKKYKLCTSRKQSIVKSDNPGIYNNDINSVPSLEAILQMPKTQAKGILVCAKQEFKSDALCKHWNIPKSRLYKYYHDFELFKDKSKNKDEQVQSVQIDLISEIDNKQIDNNVEDKDINSKDINSKDINLNEINLNEPTSENIMKVLKEIFNEKTPQPVTLPEQISQINNFKIEFNGTYDKDIIQNKLNAIINMLEMDSKYKISLSVEEI